MHPPAAGLGRAALGHLHIWSCTTRSLPSRTCYHARWCAFTAPFHHRHSYVRPLVPERISQAVCSLLHLSSRPARQCRAEHARPLAGSLLYGVRTFLSLHRRKRGSTGSDRPIRPKLKARPAQAAGGGGGIRTLDTVSRIQHFQCCAFSHSATPPTSNASYKRPSDETTERRLPAERSAPPCSRILAVRVGFEPTVQLPVHRFSRPTDSATLAPHPI